MPLVYGKARERRDKIANNKHLRELEISGFVKCIARDRCNDDGNLKGKIEKDVESLLKQFEDFKKTLTNENNPKPISAIVTQEAIADIRNVAGLLFGHIDENEE